MNFNEFLNNLRNIYLCPRIEKYSVRGHFVMPHIRNLLIHSNMENIIVLSGEQLEDVIYKTVSRCLEEKHIGNYVEKWSEESLFQG